MSELISHRHLRVLAALAWLSGGVVLLLKGTSLLLEALSQQPGNLLPWLAGGAGILIGVVDDTIDNVILRPVVAQVLQESTGAACR